MMNEKKKTATKHKPEHVIQRGEVVATIYLRQSNAGYAYLDFTLGRCWISRLTSKEVHGSSFFSRHEDQLVQVAREAAAWIRTKLQANATPSESDTDAKTP
jgi:uncharacterized protein (DUF885 family)